MTDASLAVLTGLGFPAALAARALELEGGDVQRAADMLFTNPPPLNHGPVVIDADAGYPTEVCGVSADRGTDRSCPGAAQTRQDHSLSCLVSMGFASHTAAEALRRTQGDLEAAMESLLSGGNGQLDNSVDVNLVEDHSVSSAAAPSRKRSCAPSPDVARQPSTVSAHSNNATSGGSSAAHASSSSRQSPRKAERERAPAKQAAPISTQKASSSSPKDPAAAKPIAMQVDEKQHTITHLSAALMLGPAAFGQLRKDVPTPTAQAAGHQSNVKKLIEASVPGVKKMMGERGAKYVTQMLTDCYKQGLFMHGGPTSAVNSQIIPAMHHIFAELGKQPAKDAKRVNCLTALANACQDCQQVQAREILRVFGDLSSQNATFEGQLMYSLVRQKEAALDRYITRRHASCDKDHTEVSPWQQRAHLISGYVALVGDKFGFDGVTAANSDRFLAQASAEIGKKSAQEVVSELKQEMCPKEWLQTLLSDINNQTAGADRLINRDCIFKWVQTNMSDEAAYLVFYDEERSVEFGDLDPKMPSEENQYQPFLSPKVLVDMLLKAGMLERKSPGDSKKRRWLW